MLVVKKATEFLKSVFSFSFFARPFSTYPDFWSFSISTLLPYWAGHFFALGVCPLHSRTFSIIPGHYPLDAVAFSTPTFILTIRSPGIAKCFLGRNLPTLITITSDL